MRSKLDDEYRKARKAINRLWNTTTPEREIRKLLRDLDIAYTNERRLNPRSCQPRRYAARPPAPARCLFFVSRLWFPRYGEDHTFY